MKTLRTVYHGFVGNGETAALIGPDARVTWLCLPRFDGVPVFAAALDAARGGSLQLDFGRPLTLEAQEYAGRTNVLVTRLAASELSVEVRDFMPWGRRCLIRDVTARGRGVAGHLALMPRLTPVRSSLFPLHTYLLSGAEWASRQAAAAEGPGWALVCGVLPGKTPVEASHHPVSLEQPMGQALSWRVVVAYGETLSSATAEFVRAGEETLAETVAFWEDWLARARPVNLDGTDLAEAYHRSLIVLKLLCHEPSGAILAAPTAAFPATPGGGDNWDYRYCWLRDGCYVAEALDGAGFRDEARRFYRFILGLQADDGSWPQPLYTLAGTDPVEQEAPDLAGPGGARPVRLGNKAAEQLQLDSAGHVLHGLWRHFELTEDAAFLAEAWPRVERAADWVAGNWRRKESGIWEIREEEAHWLHGKALCYAALTAGARMASALDHAEDTRAWLTEAEALRQEVVREGWSERRQAFLRDYRDDALVDISALALEFYGLVEAANPRLCATVRLMERPSDEGGLSFHGGVFRFEGAALPFYLAGFWLARHYLRTGRRQDALALVDLSLSCATTLDLMAEHFDPRTGEQWGNFPQAFSHEELVQFCLELG